MTTFAIELLLASSIPQSILDFNTKGYSVYRFNGRFTIIIDTDRPFELTCALLNEVKVDCFERRGLPVFYELTRLCSQTTLVGYDNGSEFILN